MRNINNTEDVRIAKNIKVEMMVESISFSEITMTISNIKVILVTQDYMIFPKVKSNIFSYGNNTYR